MVKIAFDIGGVLSKYPNVFRSLINRLSFSSAVISVVERDPPEVYIISDMKPHAKAVAFCHDNKFFVPPEQIICADYEKYGESCKAVVCKELGIDILIDDFIGYVATQGSPLVRLLVMPDSAYDYYHSSWKTDGSEENFGRRNPPESKRPRKEED